MNYGCINRGEIGSNGAEINAQLLQLVVSNEREKPTLGATGQGRRASLLPKSPSSECHPCSGQGALGEQLAGSCAGSMGWADHVLSTE